MIESSAYITDIHLDEDFPQKQGVDTRKKWKAKLQDISSREISNIIFGGDIGDKKSTMGVFDSLQRFEIVIPCMFRFAISLTCFFISSEVYSQELLQTIKNIGTEELVKNRFIKGNCKNVRNIQAIGNENQSIGQFNNGENIIGMNDGIILSTGKIDLAMGPNRDNESGFAFDVESPDPDLEEVATDVLFDVTGIEFDFVPIDDRVTFRYLFASEEYCEFVGTSFNDIFGFFVSGPGINGTYKNNAINVARITNLSGIEEDVSINNINHLSNQTFYVDNITTVDAQNCEVDYFETFQRFIEYDGFTIPLTASFNVIPCETYHIRMVIGDVGDAILDSAVFLESNSFDLGEKVEIEAVVPGTTERIAYESCVDGQYIFTRSDLSDLDEDCTIAFNISSDSEAVNGDDFQNIPMNITIPAGDTSYTLTVSIIEDNITEGLENLKLELMYACDCIETAFTELFIDEPSALVTSLEDIAACSGQSFRLSPAIAGGVPPYDFLWDDGEVIDTVERMISMATEYSITVTDFCRDSSFSTSNVSLQSVPVASLSGTFDLCQVATTGIPVTLEGSPPWDITYQIDGMETITINSIETNPFYIDISTAGTYEIVSFNDAYCIGEVTGMAEVEYSTFDIVLETIQPSCTISSDGAITITQLDAIEPFSISWNIDTDDEYTLNNLKEDNYVLQIIDGNGCFYEEEVALEALSDEIEDCIRIFIPNVISSSTGSNDTFSIFTTESSGIEKIISLEVYDRWGSLVYQKTNFMPDNGHTGWKGKLNGKPLTSGIYAYRVVLALEDGKELVYTGGVTLLR